MSDYDWRDDAKCTEVSPDIFFPEKGDENGRAKMARDTCSGCSVRLECLQDGVGDDWSIRAGLTARQRKNLRILSINEGVA
jgi:WhiB family redox-sensing transcriptional regulator